MEETAEFTEQQINQILDYLSKQPYKDVFSLIAMIHQVWNTRKKDNDNERL